jgi:hypothetical protein
VGVIMFKWIKRWKKIGYKELYYLHFGGAHEGDKGCKREYNFLKEVLGGWKSAYEDEKSLLIEAENLLRDNNIETPKEKRRREFLEEMSKKETK